MVGLLLPCGVPSLAGQGVSFNEHPVPTRILVRPQLPLGSRAQTHGIWTAGPSEPMGGEQQWAELFPSLAWQERCLPQALGRVLDHLEHLGAKGRSPMCRS